MVVKDNIRIENARIGFRNFSGKEGQFNPAGKRNFCVFIDSDAAETFEKDGWNIRWLQPRDENEEKQAYLQVAVSFDSPSPSIAPPKLVLVTSKGKTILDEDSANILDWAEIEKVDLTIRPYNWEVNGKKGVKAYIKAMFVTIVEDELENKYSDVPDSAINVIQDIDGN